jgi:hypothetical protein
MSTKFEVLRACEPLITAALDLAAADRHLPSGGAVRQVTDRQAALIRAALALADLHADLEPGELPRSWRRDTEGKTA